MYQLQEKKTVAMLPASFTNGATAVLGPLDTSGFDAASIDIVLGASNSTSNVPSVISIQTSDTTVASSFGAITANGQLSYGTGTSATTVTASGATGLTTYYTVANTSTGTNAPDVITVDLALVGGKQRYLKVSVSPVTTQIVAIEANLYRGGLAPSRAVDKNVLYWLTL